MSQTTLSMESQLLALVEKTTATALADVSTREQLISSWEKGAAQQADWARQVGVCQEKIQGMHALGQRIADHFTQVDKNLAAEETDLRSLLTATEDLRTTLAEGVGRAIG